MDTAGASVLGQVWDPSWFVVTATNSSEFKDLFTSLNGTKKVLLELLEFMDLSNTTFSSILENHTWKRKKLRFVWERMDFSHSLRFLMEELEWIREFSEEICKETCDQISYDRINEAEFLETNVAKGMWINLVCLNELANRCSKKPKKFRFEEVEKCQKDLHQFFNQSFQTNEMKKLVDILIKERKSEMNLKEDEEEVEKDEEKKEEEKEETKSQTVNYKIKLNLKKMVTNAKSKLKWKTQFSTQTYMDVIKLNYYQNQSLKGNKWSCTKKLFGEIGKRWKSNWLKLQMEDLLNKLNSKQYKNYKFRKKFNKTIKMEESFKPTKSPCKKLDKDLNLDDLTYQIKKIQEEWTKHQSQMKEIEVKGYLNSGNLEALNLLPLQHEVWENLTEETRKKVENAILKEKIQKKMENDLKLSEKRKAEENYYN